MTNVKKNLLIAALERALWDGKNAAGVNALTEIETTIADLRAAFISDPASVTDEQLSDIVIKISKLTFPVENPWRLYLELNGQDGAPLSNPLKVYWQNVLNKPALAAADHAHADLAPLAHSHDYAATNHAHADLAPLAHSHDYAATNHAHADLAPLAHSHDYAATNHAHADLAPLAHTHDYASITEKPATFEPAAHSHDYASITEKPATFEPAAHSHTKIVTYVGSGTTGRIISIPSYSGNRLMIFCRNNGASSAIYTSASINGVIVYNGGVITNAYTLGIDTMTLNATVLNASGANYFVWIFEL